MTKVKKLVVSFREAQGNAQILEAEMKKRSNAWAAPSAMESFKKAQAELTKDATDQTMQLLQKLSLDKDEKLLKKYKSEAAKNKVHDTKHALLLENVLGLQAKVTTLHRSIDRLEKQRQDQPSP